MTATWATFRGKEDTDYAGQYASIVPSHSLPLPWATVLEDGRKIAEHGSYNTAELWFKRAGLLYR